MIYLESIKINKFKETYSHGLSLLLNENFCHYITSNYKYKISTLYYLFKKMKNYLNGNILINNIDITKLDKNNLDNFYYKNIAFCDNELLFNEKISTKEYLSIVKNFSFNKNNPNIYKLIKIFNLNSNYLNKKIYKLNKLEKIKLIILSGILKNCKYLIINAINWNLNLNEWEEIKNICEYISKKFQKTILMLMMKNNFLDNYINLDNDDHFKFNNRLTIKEENNNFEGYKLLKHHFNIFTISIKYSYKIYFLYIFISLILMISSIFILTILNQKEIFSENNLIEYINQKEILFYILGYGLFIINLIVQIFISYLWYKNNKKYLLFLSTYNIHNLWVSLLIPILLILNTFIIVTTSYLINILILSSLDIKYNIEIWNTSLYTNLVYIIETFIISYILILRINNISNFYKVFVDVNKK